MLRLADAGAKMLRAARIDAALCAPGCHARYDDMQRWRVTATYHADVDLPRYHFKITPAAIEIMNEVPRVSSFMPPAAIFHP